MSIGIFVQHPHNIVTVIKLSSLKLIACYAAVVRSYTVLCSNLAGNDVPHARRFV